MTSTATWLNYEFQVFPAAGTTWNSVAGIYLFAGVDAYSRWVALYVGQAASFADRFRNHERWQEAHRLGATHVHAVLLPRQADRDVLERALIVTYQPPLNQQFRFAS